MLEGGGNKISNGNYLCLNEEMAQENRQLYRDYGTAKFRKISVQVNNQGGENGARFGVFVVWSNSDDIRTFRNVMQSIK